MQQETRHTGQQVLIDLCCFAAIECAIFTLLYNVEPYRRGFFCDDTNILYPFKESTFSVVTVYSVSLGLCIPTMLLIEYIIYRRNSKNIPARLRRIHPWLWRSYRVIGIFGFGGACVQFSTDFMKYITGRLRPHFLDVCQPNIDCSLPENAHRYIEDYECVDPQKDKEIRLSFPSGHASFAFYCMIYLVIYLQKNFTWEGSKLLKPFIQFICILMATSASLSRVSDYKHHWDDVLAGTLLGILIAILFTYFVSDLFENKPSPRARNST